MASYTHVFERLELAFSRCKFPSICSKPQQVQCFDFLLKGIDVVAVLPTDFGKSLVFQLLPYFLPTKCQRNIVIVISPLSSIIEDQIKVLKTRVHVFFYIRNMRIRNMRLNLAKN